MVSSEWSDTMDNGEHIEHAKTTSQSPSPTSHASITSNSDTLGSTNSQLAVQKAVEISARTGKPKRRKALRACGNCQRTHLTCDDNRPCERCVKRGCADTCADGVRKKMKYLDNGSRAPQGGLSDTFGTTGIHPVYAAHGDNAFATTSHGSVTSISNDNSVSSLVHLPHQGQLPPMPSHNHAHNHAHDHAHNHAGHHVKNSDGMMFHARDSLGHQNHGDFGVEQVGPMSQSSVVLDSDNHLSNSSLALQHGLSVGPVTTSALQVLSHDSGSNNSGATATAATALITPSQDSNAFHSYAADSEYTVVARMLENSRAKSDQDFSPTDSPKFSSSNVDLRNFVTLQPLSQDATQSPAEAGYTSWLDPPPPPPPAVVVQRRKSGMSNFKRVDSDGSDQSVASILPHPSSIYRNVREPYPYTPAFHGLLSFLKQRFPREQLMRIIRSMARIRPSFIAVTKDLTHEDLVFMEQCFQRSLFEYEKFFAYSGTPSIVWRRTGQIAAVAPEFCMLTQWPRHELRSRFIVEVMSDESAVDYFERFSEMTFTDKRGEIMYDCSLLTPMGQQIRTSAVLTIRKDLFGIPMTIIGNFLPHV